MKLYKIPTKSDNGADMFVDLDQVEMVSCRLDHHTTDIQDIVAGSPAPPAPVPIIRLGTSAGRNVEFSLGSVEVAEQWLHTHFGLTYKFSSN